MKRYHILDKRQSDSAAETPQTFPGRDLIERFENLLPVGLGNSLAVVLDINTQQPLLGTAGPDHDPGIVRRMFDCIGKQIRNHPVQQIRIGPEVIRKIPLLQIQTNTALIGGRTEILELFGEKPPAIDLRQPQFHVAVFDLPEIEQLIDKQEYPIRIFIDLPIG